MKQNNDKQLVLPKTPLRLQPRGLKAEQDPHDQRLENVSGLSELSPLKFGEISDSVH